MSVRDQQRERKWVREWRKKLSPLAASVKDKNPRTALHALDIALLETAIYGLSAYNIGFAQTVVEDTLYGVLESFGNPNHWRNRESMMEKIDEAAEAEAQESASEKMTSKARPAGCTIAMCRAMPGRPGRRGAR